MQLEDFYTRDIANAGIELPLYTRDGKRTDHWLKVYGVDSDAYRLASLEGKKRAIEIGFIKDEKQRLEEQRKNELRVMSAIVYAWSFEQECTREAVEQFFINAPQILDYVDYVARNREIFFSKGSASLNATPSNNLGSTKSRKAQPARRAKA